MPTNVGNSATNDQMSLAQKSPDAKMDKNQQPGLMPGNGSGVEGEENGEFFDKFTTVNAKMPGNKFVSSNPTAQSLSLQRGAAQPSLSTVGPNGYYPGVPR